MDTPFDLGDGGGKDGFQLFSAGNQDGERYYRDKKTHGELKVEDKAVDGCNDRTNKNESVLINGGKQIGETDHGQPK